MAKIIRINPDEFLKEILQGRELTKKEIISLLSLNEEDSLVLYKIAEKVTKEIAGEDIFIRGIIEFSNYCNANCLYCGLRKDNLTVRRYRIDPKTIFKISKDIKETGIKTVILQSGEDSYYTKEAGGLYELLDLIAHIKKELDLTITLSLGERSFEDYKLFKEAGVTRYLLKHETADLKLYSELRPQRQLENRINCLRNLKNLGFETGSGIMVGLPKQSIESIADDILLFKQLDIDMIGIGPFIPHQNTPLRDQKAGSLNLTFKTIATTRLVNQRSLIPATTAISTLNPEGRKVALQAGSNVVMLDATDEEYKKHYEIYPDRYGRGVSLKESYKKTKTLIESIGRKIQ